MLTDTQQAGMIVLTMCGFLIWLVNGAQMIVEYQYRGINWYNWLILFSPIVIGLALVIFGG